MACRSRKLCVCTIRILTSYLAAVRIIVAAIMRVTSNTAILLGLIAQAAAAPTPESQAPLKEPTPNRERAAEVQRVFQESWEGYYKNAFPHDSLRPVANTVEDDR